MPVEFNFHVDEFIDWFDEDQEFPMYSSGDEYIDQRLSAQGYVTAEVLG